MISKAVEQLFSEWIKIAYHFTLKQSQSQELVLLLQTGRSTIYR